MIMYFVNVLSFVSGYHLPIAVKKNVFLDVICLDFNDPWAYFNVSKNDDVIFKCVKFCILIN